MIPTDWDVENTSTNRVKTHSLLWRWVLDWMVSICTWRTTRDIFNYFRSNTGLNAHVVFSGTTNRCVKNLAVPCLHTTSTGSLSWDPSEAVWARVPPTVRASVLYVL